jgi:hypothetical protein
MTRGTATSGDAFCARTSTRNRKLRPKRTGALRSQRLRQGLDVHSA